MKKPSAWISPLIILSFVAFLFGCGGSGSGSGLTGGKTTATNGTNSTTTSTNGTSATNGTTGNGVPTYTIEAIPVASGSAVQSADGVDSAGDVLYTVSGPIGDVLDYPLYAYRYSAATKKSTLLGGSASGTPRCGAAGMNDAGIGVGNLGLGTETTQGVVWQAGATVYEVLGSQGGWVTTFANSVNNSGQIVGYATNASGVHIPVLWNASKPSEVTVLQSYISGDGCIAASINDSGQIVGTSTESLSQTTAVYWSSPTAKPIPLAGQTRGQGSFITNAGLIFGVDLAANSDVYWSSPSASEANLAVTDANYGGINDSGDLVGGVFERFGRARPQIGGNEDYPFIDTPKAGFVNLNNQLDSTSKAAAWTFFPTAIGKSGVIASYGYQPANKKATGWSLVILVPTVLAK